MANVAIYPGTFDPITNGHVDIIYRASKLFDRIIITVAKSQRKEPLFALKDRLAMIETLFAATPDIVVLPLEGLLVNFATQQQATIILRGLRAMSDFDYEFQMAGMNHQMSPAIETIFLPANENYRSISATMVREIIHLGGDVAGFVPEIVLDYINKKLPN